MRCHGVSLLCCITLVDCGELGFPPLELNGPDPDLRARTPSTGTTEAEAGKARIRSCTSFSCRRRPDPVAERCGPLGDRDPA